MIFCSPTNIITFIFRFELQKHIVIYIYSINETILYRSQVQVTLYQSTAFYPFPLPALGERGGSVVECRTSEREVGGSKPTAAVLCP